MFYHSRLETTPPTRQLRESVGMGDDQAEFWRAVEMRNARFDGAFVFAVRSTGVFCRPSCPARRPRRENVQFFQLPEAAERAGYRACRRCRPKEAAGSNPQIEIVNRVCRLIEDRPEAGLTLAEMSAEVGLSPFHLQRLFKKATGVTPRQYAVARRAELFRDKVRSSGASVAEAMYDAGYGSSSRLYEHASDEFGMTPAVYRKGGRGMKISYTTAKCALGRLLVASTEKGICEVSLGDSEESLESGLKEEYPEAEIRRDDHALGSVVKTLLAHLAGEEPHLNLPIDVQATAFQRRVWEELKKIPYGQTRSYGDVAAAIGRPSATRAVARACALNHVALVVPCHRVIRGDKSLGGYKWGLGRKQFLLQRESSK
jgi:AraC family transcriptional regulator of adaptative response/methylated-DNA-[protein]-cysteine methyltransferase